MQSVNNHTGTFTNRCINIFALILRSCHLAGTTRVLYLGSSLHGGAVVNQWVCSIHITILSLVVSAYWFYINLWKRIWLAVLPKYLTVYNVYLEAHNRILIMKTVVDWKVVKLQQTIDFHSANVGNIVNFVVMAKNWNVPEVVNLHGIHIILVQYSREEFRLKGPLTQCNSGCFSCEHCHTYPYHPYIPISSHDLINLKLSRYSVQNFPFLFLKIFSKFQIRISMLYSKNCYLRVHSSGARATASELFLGVSCDLILVSITVSVTVASCDWTFKRKNSIGTKCRNPE